MQQGKNKQEDKIEKIQTQIGDDRKEINELNQET